MTAIVSKLSSSHTRANDDTAGSITIFLTTVVVVVAAMMMMMMMMMMMIDDDDDDRYTYFQSEIRCRSLQKAYNISHMKNMKAAKLGDDDDEDAAADDGPLSSSCCSSRIKRLAYNGLIIACLVVNALLPEFGGVVLWPWHSVPSTSTMLASFGAACCP
jgi:hypothetical protein